MYCNPISKKKKKANNKGTELFPGAVIQRSLFRAAGWAKQMASGVEASSLPPTAEAHLPPSARPQTRARWCCWALPAPVLLPSPSPAPQYMIHLCPHLSHPSRTSKRAGLAQSEAQEECVEGVGAGVKAEAIPGGFLEEVWGAQVRALCPLMAAHVCSLQISSSTSTRRAPQGFPKLPLWCTAGKGQEPGCMGAPSIPWANQALCTMPSQILPHGCPSVLRIPHAARRHCL